MHPELPHRAGRKMRVAPKAWSQKWSCPTEGGRKMGLAPRAWSQIGGCLMKPGRKSGLAPKKWSQMMGCLYHSTYLLVCGLKKGFAPRFFATVSIGEDPTVSSHFYRGWSERRWCKELSTSLSKTVGQPIICDQFFTDKTISTSKSLFATTFCGANPVLRPAS